LGLSWNRDINSFIHSFIHPSTEPVLVLKRLLTDVKTSTFNLADWKTPVSITFSVTTELKSHVESTTEAKRIAKETLNEQRKNDPGINATSCGHLPARVRGLGLARMADIEIDFDCDRLASY
jgi:hypothetical protein